MEFIKNHFTVFVCATAVAVAALYLAPQFLIKRTIERQGGTYLFLQSGDEILQYMARAREVYDGHFPPSDLTFEGKPVILNPIPPLVFSAFITFFRGDIQSAYFAAIAIFSAGIFLLFYWAGRVFLDNKLWAWGLATVATLTALARAIPYAFFSISIFTDMVVKNFYPWVRTAAERLPLLRMDDPLLTIPFFLPAVIFIFRFWMHPTERNAVWTGIFSGLLFYVYFHNWVYIVTLLGVLFLIACLERRRNADRVPMFVFVFSILGVFSLPYIFQFNAFMGLAASRDYIARLGQYMTHGLNLTAYPYYIAFGIFAVLIYAAFFRHDRDRALFYWGNILASIAVFNVQIVTGLSVMPENWIRSFGIVFFLLTFNLIYRFAEMTRALKAAGAVLCIAAFLLLGKRTINAALFINPPQSVLQYYVFNPRIIDSFAWMNENLPHEPRVVSDSYLTTDYFTSYTSARPFMPTGANAIVDNRTLEDRFLLANALFGVSPDVLRQRLEKSQITQLMPNWKTPDILRNLNLYNAQGYLYTNFYEDRGYLLPAEKIQELMTRYQALKPAWKNVEAEYVYVGPFEKEFGGRDFSRDSQLKRLYSNGDVEIFEIQK